MDILDFIRLFLPEQGQYTKGENSGHGVFSFFIEQFLKMFTIENYKYGKKKV